MDQTPPLIAGGSANATQQSRPSASTGSPGLVPWDVPPQPRAAQPRTQAQPLSRQALTAQAQRGQQEQPRQSATDNTRALSEKGSHSLKNIALQITGDKIRVRIEADNAFPCKSFVLTNPDRLVVDLPGTWSNMKVPSVPRNEVVKNIRHGKQASGPRLVLDLNKTLKNHTVQRSGNVVEIVLQ